MTLDPDRHVVVVDGSNLATEGRTTPSLKQLDEAVRAYAAEDPKAEIVVVVDASFEHRIDPSEHKQYADAELHGELVSPPAGAIGRGDAFVLRIAERTGARVLSNDSFQEFHAEHPWLFDEGRLVGGKPVPGVGWIFTPRIPVRGPKSRQVTGKAKRREREELSPPVKAAELAKAAKKLAARKAPAATLPDGSKPKVGDVWPSKAAASSAKTVETSKKKAKKTEAASPPEVREKARSDKHAKVEQRGADGGQGEGKGARAGKAVEPKLAGQEKVTARADERAKKEPAKKRAAAASPTDKAAAPTKAPAKKQPAKKAPAKKRTPEIEAPGVGKAVAKAAPAKKTPPKKTAAKAKAAAAKAAAKKSAPGKSSAPKEVASVAPSARSAAGTPAKRAKKTNVARSAAAKNPVVQEAIGQALAEVTAPLPEPVETGRDGRGDHKHAKHDGKGSKQRRRRAASPPPAVNEPLAFITFVATYPLDTELEGEVVSFTSHGAMVDVDLPNGGVLHSYIPLTAMDDPPPTKARQLLKRGERRTFVLLALDPPRRVAELGLPEFVAAHGGAGARA